MICTHTLAGNPRLGLGSPPPPAAEVGHPAVTLFPGRSLLLLWERSPGSTLGHHQQAGAVCSMLNAVTSLGLCLRLERGVWDCRDPLAWGGALQGALKPLAPSLSSLLAPAVFLSSYRTPHSSHVAHLRAYLPLSFVILLPVCLFVFNVLGDYTIYCSNWDSC